MLVHRKSYVRSDGVRVKATSFRIKNRGRSGRGPKLFKLKKGGLSKYGYKTKSALESRHMSLSNAISRGVPSLTLSQRLGALATLLKRTNPTLSKRIRRDQKWVSKTS
jgi:hypothetical protein